MGWEWREETDESDLSVGFGALDEAQNSNSGSGERCSTRRIVRSHCKTEEMEPGKFIRKCEKNEQVLKDCVGRPVEVVQSNTEYTEDDVSNEIVGGSLASGSSRLEPFNFPGLRSDIESIERSLFGSLGSFFEAAEEMKNGFFRVFGAPHLPDEESSSSFRRGIPIEGPGEREGSQRATNQESAYSDFAGQVRDV